MKLRQKTWIDDYETAIWFHGELDMCDRVKSAKHYLVIAPKVINAIKHNIKIAKNYINKHKKG